MKKITRFLTLAALSALPSGLMAADASMFAPATSGRAFDMICGPQGIMAGMPGCGEPGLFSAIFTIFNAGIMAVAALWFAWTAMAAVAQTAHDGEFLGKRFSSLWMPIRVVLGATAIVPIVNGFNLAQIVMMWGALTGVTIADKTWGAVASGLGQGLFAVGEQQARPMSSGVFNTMLKLEVCLAGINKDGVNAEGGVDFTGAVRKKAEVYEYGKLENGDFDATCGKISTGLIQWDSELQFVYNTSKTILGPVAAGIVDGEKTDPRGAVAKADAAYIEYLRNRFVEKTQDNGTSKVLERLQDPGRWIEAGAWYQTVATVSSRNATWAAPHVSGGISEGLEDNLGSATFSNTLFALKRLDSQIVNSESATDETDPKASMEAAFQSVKDGGYAGLQSTWGQAIARTLLFGFDGATTKNPMVTAKDLGDGMITAGWTVLGTYGVVKASVDGADSGLGGLASKALPVSPTGWVASALNTLEPYLFVTLMFLFITGATLAVYIPFVPFIQWIAAVIQYLIIVLEAMVSAPLWAMVHMDTDGEGLGQRTTYGYLFLLNVLFRPVLMIIGFVGAAAILWLAGTLLNDLFQFAMFNANNDGSAGGQATFGLVSIIAVIVVYVSMMLMLINGTFNLVHILPDKVLNWVGGQFHYSQGGQDAAAAGHSFDKYAVTPKEFRPYGKSNGRHGSHGATAKIGNAKNGGNNLN